MADDSAAGKIVGYVISWMIGETMEIHKIAVKRDYWRRGIASRMMDALLETAARGNITGIFLEVRKSNTAALRLYEKYKFKQIAERKDYFSNPREEALVYALYLKGPANLPHRTK